ncbi:MAG: S8 family serine peptidase [Actinobacteria bacterium]|nr:S8 family serine peptidase [Actinomycetota bacterium]
MQVTAVVQEADGHLTFRTQKAADRAAGTRLAGRWRAEPRVVAAEVEHRVHVTGTPDPLQDRQWGLSALSAQTLWAAGDASGQTVAVIDTGVDATHPDLAGVVLPGRDFVDSTGDGRTDPNGHGTHVSGIVAAVGGNGIGGAGLAPGARVLPVRVMDATGSGFDSDAARGLVWATDHGATVANMSLGGPDRSSVMDTAVTYALNHGVSVVVSAGNAGLDGDPVEWPAANPGVIAVGAVDIAGVRPGWSSSGPHLAVAAPGVGILSTVPGGGYSSWSGTSMAAPFVSASVALLRHGAALTPAQVRSRLMSTAVDLGESGFDPLYGAGRVDPAAAEGLAVVAAAPAPVVAEAPAPAPAPAPVVTEAPAPAPAPVVTEAPAPAPVVTEAPAPAPIVTEAPAPAPVVSEPAAEPVAAVVAPRILSARISATRSSVPYGSSVTVSTRTLADGVATGGVPVRLERLVGTSWLLTRTGTTGADGLAGWALRPDRTSSYRIVGYGWTSRSIRIAVTPVVQLSRYLTGRVLPGAVTTVRLQQRRSTGWVTLAYATSSSTGAFRFTRRLAAGTVVRAVAYGIGSTAVRI